MGIPRFAAWLTKKFPPMARRDAPANVHGLYIDMNGVIHPCCHSEDDPSVSKRPEEEKIESVCRAVGNLVDVAKPTHILFLAMDGVAPRAKMNQQRARRYMSAVPKYGVDGCVGALAAASSKGTGLAPKDHGFSSAERKAAEAELKKASAALDVGIYSPPLISPGETTDTDIEGRQKPKPSLYKKGGTDEIDCGETTGRKDSPLTTAELEAARFDSNCISPGTEFMRKCSDRLKEYVAENLSSNPQWKGLAVVVSDTNTPGEGEHKIIDFIRTQIGYGNSWSGNGAHVIHGNDADLILLCLGLHIPRIVLCRENYNTGTHIATSPGIASPPTSVLSPSSAPLSSPSPIPAGLISPSPLPIISNEASPVIASKTKTNTSPPSVKAKEEGGKDEGEASDVASDTAVSDTEGGNTNGTNKKDNKGSGGGRGKGGRRGPRWFAPKPRFEWYDIDIVGSCIMTEIFDTSKRASAVLRDVPDYQTYTESTRLKKKLVVGAGGVGQVVNASAAGSAKSRKDKSKERTQEVETQPQDTEAAVASNHASFLARSTIPVDPKTGFVLAHPCTTPCNHRVIDDFITLATLMGNDFMPRVPSCFCGDSGMDNIMEVYMRCVLPYGYLSNPVTNDLDLKQLHRFFLGYAMLETTLFRQFCIKEGLLTPAEAMSLSAESLGGSARGKVHLPSSIDEKWRSLYYASTTIGSSKEDINKACRSYVEGIRFVLRYYSTTSRTTSWSWYFPFHHSPFAADLANFIEPFLSSPKPEEALPPPKLELIAPLPFPQLMAILPPTSAQLLPKSIGTIMKAPPTALASTFPSSWKVDFAAADGREHLAAVLLPFADFGVLIETANKCADTFTDEERSRNVNKEKQCVLINGEAALRGGAVASDAVANATKVIEDRVRGGIEFQNVFSTTKGAEQTSTSTVLEFTYVDIPSRFVGKNKVYSSTFKPVESLAATGESLSPASPSAAISSRDEKNAKMYKRRTDQNNKAEVAGYRYWPKGGHFLSATERGWFMSLADFHLGAGVIAAFVTFFTTVIVSSTAAPSACLCTLVLSGLSNAIVAGFVFAIGSIFLCVLGVGVTNPRKDSGIRRNNIRDSYVDWLCSKCLSLNFRRNEKCFTCGYPCDESKTAWAVFTNKLANTPDHLDPNHKPHIIDIRVKFPEVVDEKSDMQKDAEADRVANLSEEDSEFVVVNNAAAVAEETVAAAVDSAVRSASSTPPEEGNCDML